jgi:hypothetical protein
MMNGKAIPADWTNGTGTISAAGTIAIAAEPQRTGIYIQNQGAAAISLVVPSTQGTTAVSSNVTLTIAAGTTLSLADDASGFFTNGPLTVVGAAGAQNVAILTF